MRYDYLLCNWRVRSELELPQLLRWTGPDRPADIAIREGRTPVRLGNPASPGRWWTVDADGTVLLVIPGLARFLVEDGRSVTVEILGHEAAQGWRTFLLGPVLNCLCHQRGLFPLQAAGLKIGTRTIALAGRSGVGKSTLAFALLQRGHRLLADDVTVLETESDGGCRILPAHPHMHLWHDTCRAFGVDAENLPRVRDGLDRFDCGPGPAFDSSPCRLDGVVILYGDAKLDLEREAKTQAVLTILSHIGRPAPRRFLGGAPHLFAQAAKISRHIDVLRLRRPKTFDALPAAIDLVEEYCGS